MAGLRDNPELIAGPWPHGVIDDFLPPDLYAVVVQNLPVVDTETRTMQSKLGAWGFPAAAELEAFLAAIAPVLGTPKIELTYRTRGLRPHEDRKDKVWSGVIYLCGSDTGTVLHGRDGSEKLVEFRPNRLLYWPRGEWTRHSAPAGAGRWAVQWWIMQ